MAWEAIFATISPFLVIDDNTTKSKQDELQEYEIDTNLKS